MTTAIECVEPIETDDITEGRGSGRRSALLASASAVIAGLATLLDAKPAAADCLGSPCCELASCTWCNYQVSPDRYTCPEGYTRVMWTCRSGSVTWGCGECGTDPTSCWRGRFACSVYFRW
jgi:hypothetical protein